jgi:hypothetical protein
MFLLERTWRRIGTSYDLKKEYEYKNPPPRFIENKRGVCCNPTAELYFFRL